MKKIFAILEKNDPDIKEESTTCKEIIPREKESLEIYQE